MSKILSVEQERETINWYSKQPPPWSGIILALFFSHHPLSVFFPHPFFTNQTSEFPGNKIGHWVGGWLYFILIMTPRSQGLCRWFQWGDSQCHPSHVGPTHTHTHTLSLRQPSCWPWAESGVSCPPNCIPTPPHPTPLHPERSHNANPASEGKKMTGSRPVTAGWIAQMTFN